MTAIGEKVAYVKSQRQTRRHQCHWPTCNKEVPPALWGCKAHWYALPARLRREIWASYRPGQEKDLAPSKKYLEVAQRVQQWIRDNYGIANNPHRDGKHERKPPLDLLDEDPG